MSHASVRPSRYPPGHVLVHVGLVLLCFSRAFAYSDFLTPAILSPGPMVLTDDGQWLGLYAVLWAVAGALAIVDGVRGRVAWALPAFVGIAVVWTLSYVGAWWLSDWHSPDWMTAALYGGAAVLALGTYGRMLTEQTRRDALTSTLPQAAGREEDTRGA